MKKNKLFLIALAVCTYLLVFRAFFINKSLSWGDAPFFYQENLRELFSLPFLWDFRNANFGAPQAGILWLYLPTFLFGLLNSFLNTNSGILIRIIFYFPATLFSIFGTYLFLGLIIRDFRTKMLGSFLYTFNTYFLMVLDGGQIGVGLAYGLFPISSYFILKLLNEFQVKNFIWALITILILTNVDLRVAIINILFTLTAYSLLYENNIKDFGSRTIKFSLLIISILLINSFWVIPFLVNAGEFPGGRFTEVVKNNNLISILDSIYLYQPHFPLNDFGKIFPAPFYFGFLPFILIIPNLFRRKNLKVIILFLVLIFLSKGQNEPGGEIYHFLVKKIPLGQAFRDSTKFYIPLMFTGAILLALSYEEFIRKKWILISKNHMAVLLTTYMLILIYPAVFGNLTGSLSTKKDNESFNTIYKNIKIDEKFYRTLWFPETPPLAFTSINHPAIYANRLYQERPFASMIDGDYDLFGFLNHPNFNNWVSLIGGKYLFFPENERKKNWTDKEKQERNLFLEFISELKGFSNPNWNINFSVLKNESEVMPHIFAQRKNYLIVGGDNIYNKLFENKEFNLAAQGFLFPESCKFEINTIKNIDSNDLEIFYFNKNQQDLAMTFLCDKFISAESAEINQWAYANSNQYLNWKSELLEKGIRTYEYDFNKGIAYSTVKNEKVIFNLSVDEDGQYFLPIRYTDSTKSAGIKVKFVDFERDLKNQTQSSLKWEFLGPFKLNRGKQKIEIINNGGVVVFNTLGLIKKSDFEHALYSANKLSERFKTYNIKDETDISLLKLEKDIIELKYQASDPTNYILKIPNEARWIIFTDHFHNGWKLTDENKFYESLPVYTMFNGFYISSQSFNKQANILFSPQKLVPKSIIVSLTSIFLVTILIIFISRSKNE